MFPSRRSNHNVGRASNAREMDDDYYGSVLREFESQLDLERCRTVVCKGDVCPRALMDHLTSWISATDIECLQRKSETVYNVTFSKKAIADALVEMGPIIEMVSDFQKKEFLVHRTIKKGEKVRKIFVKQLPAGFNRRELAHSLAKYGSIVSVTPEFYRVPGIEYISSGTWIVQMVISEPVPNYLRIRGHEAVCSYSMVKKVCRICGKDDHFAASCAARKYKGNSQKQDSASGNSSQKEAESTQQNQKVISQPNQEEIVSKTQKGIVMQDQKKIPQNNEKKSAEPNQKEMSATCKKDVTQQNEVARKNSELGACSSGATPKKTQKSSSDSSSKHISDLRQDFINQIECIRESIRDLEERKKEGKLDPAKLDERINSYHKIEKLLVADYAKSLALIDSEQLG